MTELTDPLELLNQIAKQDTASERAMHAFYEQFHEPIYHFVANVLPRFDNQDIESVTVETLFEVWKCAASFEGGAQVKTWVLGIAKHKALDAARKHKRLYDRQTSLDEGMVETVEDGQDSSFDVLVRCQQASWLEKCLAKLPQVQRECIYLLLTEGLSLAGISDVQSCAQGTVKTRIFHGKKNLKQCLSSQVNA